jgi:hypothetical protein
VTGRRARVAALAASVVAVGLLRLATRAPPGDSWDAIGFARAVQHFDLAAFQPHFPGYPVYVAACKLVRSPQLVSAIASAATALALWRLGAALAGRASAGFVALALWAGALGPWLAGGAALADATATAFVAAAFAALTFAGAPAAGLGAAAMALAIGTRVSYWPLALSYAVVVARCRPAGCRAAAAGAVAATLAWALPFIAVVGLGPLLALGRVQLAGHFADWGGSVATRPDLVARAAAFARDLVYDGLWPNRYLLVPALAGCALVCRRPSPRARAIAAIVVVPYALWVLLAQNVLEQPRHLLPLVAAFVVALAVASARRPLVGAALAALALAASAPLMLHRGPPAAAVVAARLHARYPEPGAVVVFARRSARVIDAAVPSLPTHAADRVSDILATLERVDVLPRHIFYVAEELVDDEPARTKAADDSLHFCRDPRLDRQSPCVTLRSYNLHP